MVQYIVTNLYGRTREVAADTIADAVRAWGGATTKVLDYFPNGDECERLDSNDVDALVLVHDEDSNEAHVYSIDGDQVAVVRESDALEVSRGTYVDALREAQDASPLVREATTAADDLPDAGRWFLLWVDGAVRGGFAIVNGDELVGVWGRGYGDDLVREAIARGASRLDCFDGYLPRFYARHGFREVRREANWTPGGPDVVWMARG